MVSLLGGLLLTLPAARAAEPGGASVPGSATMLGGAIQWQPQPGGPIPTQPHERGAQPQAGPAPHQAAPPGGAEAAAASAVAPAPAAGTAAELPLSAPQTIQAASDAPAPAAASGPAPAGPSPTPEPGRPPFPAEPGVLVLRDAPGDSPTQLPGPAGAGSPGDDAEPGGSRDQANRRELVLDRRSRQLLVVEDGIPMRRFPVAVGMPGWETPVGRFSVIEMQTNPTWEHPVSGLLIQPGPDNPLGSRWIGFYRDCQGRSGFNGQEHLVVQGCVVAGFHGTPNRASIGQAASHGCVRLYDEHVRDLFNLVRLGTPVTVLP